ncbi:hypothetical protein DPMN_029095 [Dreissena polymorpha]|uniref:Uncharacterized protein n=1 Tax=Dreissena polymorpha TaxID=45954 RepID=A0A9D4LY43_DREPO|nr:hypothetical protein DPMN_029095 [Dreissena polymorpha]
MHHDFRCVEMSEPISWKGAENLGLKMLTCRGDAVHQPFYIRVSARHISYSSTDNHD